MPLVTINTSLLIAAGSITLPKAKARHYTAVAKKRRLNKARHATLKDLIRILDEQVKGGTLSDAGKRLGLNRHRIAYLRNQLNRRTGRTQSAA